MDEKDAAKIVMAMEHIERSVTVLRRKRESRREAFLNNSDVRDVVERRFETAIQACIDIAAVVVANADGAVPETNRNTVGRLAALDIVSEPTGEELQEAVGFRNVLAHQYGVRIDEEIVYERLDNLDVFVSFVDEVYEYMDQEGYF